MSEAGFEDPLSIPTLLVPTDIKTSTMFGVRIT